MRLCKFQFAAVIVCGALCFGGNVQLAFAQALPPANPQRSSSSSNPMPQEKAPSLVDPAGPTISLVSSEPVFLMAAALNACGYDQGLEKARRYANACARK